jgi:hypothetical protein
LDGWPEGTWPESVVLPSTLPFIAASTSDRLAP